MSVTKKRIFMNFGYDNMTVNQLMISRQFYYVTILLRNISRQGKLYV